jgi:predicted dienelactone hydrolase
MSLADWLAPGPHGVGYSVHSLVDDTRTTPAYDDVQALDSRVLDLRVYYPSEVGSLTTPESNVPAAPGRHPLVVHSHGFASAAADHLGLARWLATQGYVVALIQYPLTSRLTPGGPQGIDSLNQPGDVSFVIDELLAAHEFIDPDRIAASGLSLGGWTTLAVGLHPAVRDDRLKALVAMAPATCSLGTDILDEPGPPLMIMHGDADAILAYEDHIPPLWDGLTGPRWLATLHEGTHTGFPDLVEHLLDGLDHADSLGCSALEGALDPDPPPLTVDPLDGQGDVLGIDCARACQGVDELTGGMKPSRQVPLSFAITHAFLDTVLRADEEAALWLRAGVGLQEDDVTLDLRGVE